MKHTWLSNWFTLRRGLSHLASSVITTTTLKTNDHLNFFLESSLNTRLLSNDKKNRLWVSRVYNKGSVQVLERINEGLESGGHRIFDI